MNKDEIKALFIFYSQPYRRRNITYQMIREFFDILREKKPDLAPIRAWEAYAHFEKSDAGSPKSELTALVSIIRRIVDIHKELTDYDTIAHRNFRDWVVHAQSEYKHSNQEQMEWLYMIRDHVATSFHIDPDDFDLSPFGERGGLRKWLVSIPVFSAEGHILVIAFSLLTAFLSIVMSNTATAGLMVPIAMSVVAANPTVLAVVIALSSSFDKILPVSTPPNAMVFSTKAVHAPVVLRAGAVISAIALSLLFLRYPFFIERFLS